MTRGTRVCIILARTIPYDPRAPWHAVEHWPLLFKELRVRLFTTGDSTRRDPRGHVVVLLS